MKTERDIKEMLIRYAEGKATAEECDILESWYFKYNDKKSGLSENELEEQLKLLDKGILPLIRKHAYANFLTLKVAAGILLIAVIGALYYFWKAPMRADVEQRHVMTANSAQKPGGNKAMIYSADGIQLPLENMDIGSTQKLQGLLVKKTADGQLILSVDAKARSSAFRTDYNRIETPRGGQYQIQLADGSKVWLNTESTLKFPTVFATTQRMVELTGEAYFEIAPAKTPFIVKSEQQKVRVLGTHFNINAYPEEATIRTSLLEGKIQIQIPGSNSALIRPGQEGVVSKGKNNNIQVYKANLEHAVAWKNGLFDFEDATVREVILQLSRWYNVDVHWKNINEKQRFSGKFFRDINLNQAIDILKHLGIHVKLEQKSGTQTLTVGS